MADCSRSREESGRYPSYTVKNPELEEDEDKIQHMDLTSDMDKEDKVHDYQHWF